MSEEQGKSQTEILIDEIICAGFFPPALDIAIRKNRELPGYFVYVVVEGKDETVDAHGETIREALENASKVLLDKVWFLEKIEVGK